MFGSGLRAKSVPNFPARATEAFESGARLVISAATYWEIAVKDSLGKLRYGERSLELGDL